MNTQTWFECKIRYDKTQENGLVKKVTEAYLVDAISHAEAEEQIIKEITPYTEGDLKVVRVAQAHLAGVYPAGGSGIWWTVRDQFITLDECSGAEKRTTVRTLVEGTDISEVLDTATKTLGNCDHDIISIAKTAILDVFVYAED